MSDSQLRKLAIGSCLGGIDVRIAKFLDEGRYKQVRFPRSKGKRIRRKWRKDRRNWVWDEGKPVFYEVRPMRGLLGIGMTPGYFVANPVAFRLLKEALSGR